MRLPELVNLPVDLIVAWGTPASLAAHKATDTIPIVMSAGDPVGAGIVAGLAHPGGNVTGISVQMAEQEGKRLELLKKLLPSFSRVAVLSNPSNPYCAIAVGEAQRGAAALGLQVDLVEASDARSLDAAFMTLSRMSSDAVLVVADPFLAGERVRIADEMIKNKLPSIYSYHEHVRAGGLMTYTTNYYDVFRRQGKVIVRRQLKRRYVLTFFQKLPPCLVGIEACASSHYWSRELQALGHTVRLMPPAYVKPYVKRQKNDSADAEAIPSHTPSVHSAADGRHQCDPSSPCRVRHRRPGRAHWC
jgi:ABC transporter substrate binding protein